MFKDLREYVTTLESEGLLKRVRVPLSPVLEIPEALRQAAKKGLTLMFENVEGYPGWKVVGNLFVTFKHIKIALEIKDLDDIGKKLENLLPFKPPYSLTEKVKLFKDIISLSKFTPRVVKRAYFLDNVVEKPRNLVKLLPAFKQYPGEAGRYLTYPLVTIYHPENNVVTMSVYRVMLLEDALVVHWQIHKRGRLAEKQWADRREEMPIAIVIGSDPATLISAAMPVPYPLDKLLFAGILRGQGLNIYKLDNGVPVPANAEVVIEGWVKGDKWFEGPFGDHWGFYDKPHRLLPVVHVERIYFRNNPIFHGTTVGKVYCEDSIIGKVAERLFLPILRLVAPEIVDINIPAEACFHGLAIVSIRKMYPGHGKKIMMLLWGLGLLSLTKILVVVDEDVDPHDMNQVMWAIASYVDPARDIVIVPNAPVDELDPSTPTPGLGSKLGIDATRKLPEEFGGEPPVEIEEPPKHIVEKVKRVLDELS